MRIGTSPTEIQSALSRNEIRRVYRQLRRAGLDKHQTRNVLRRLEQAFNLDTILATVERQRAQEVR